MRKLFLSLAFLAVVAVPMSAATDGGYSSDHIRAAAQRLNVSADSLAVGDTRMKVKGSTILVRKIENGDIDLPCVATSLCPYTTSWSMLVSTASSAYLPIVCFIRM